MSFDESKYVDPEQFLCFNVEGDGYIWACCLYERKGGGFDLYLAYEASEFEPLEVDKITWLRHQAGDKTVILIAQFPDAKFTKAMTQKIGDSLVAWLAENIGVKLKRHRCEQVDLGD